MINFKCFSKNIGIHKYNYVDSKLRLYITAVYPTSSFIYEDNLDITINCNETPKLYRKDIKGKLYCMKPWKN